MFRGTRCETLLRAVCLMAFLPYHAKAAARQSIAKHKATNRLSELMKASVTASVAASAEESFTGYSTNAICRQYNCINPVVPGMQDLLALNATTWQCQKLVDARPFLNFCKDAILYDIAVPDVPNATSVEAVVSEQDNMAATAYFYALSGMNLEPWQHRKPAESTSDCAKAIWSTTCSTYFPRAQAGCNAGEKTPYLRPCRNVCENYLNACQVQCCDESVKCVFEKQVSLLGGGSATLSGYSSELGPSALCTGSGASSRSLSTVLFFALFMKMISGR